MEITLAGLFIGHVVGIPIEHALCNWDVEVTETSDGIFGFGDVLVAKEHGAMRVQVGPVGFSTDSTNAVAVWSKSLFMPFCSSSRFSSSILCALITVSLISRYVKT